PGEGGARGAQPLHLHRAVRLRLSQRVRAGAAREHREVQAGIRRLMNRNLLFAVAAIAIVGLVGFAVVHSSNTPPASVRAPASGASAPQLPANVPFIEQAEAKRLVDANGATMLDVRDADAYLA